MLLRHIHLISEKPQSRNQMLQACHSFTARCQATHLRISAAGNLETERTMKTFNTGTHKQIHTTLFAHVQKENAHATTHAMHTQNTHTHNQA